MRPIPDTILTLTAAVLLLITAAVSCSGIRSGDVTAVLSAADSLMKTRPATALDTLRAIDSTALSGLSRKQTAYYRLLMTEAKYKCWMSVAKDTAVFETAEYYRKHGPESLYARALMISGTVLQESGRPVLALEAYKAAEPVMEAVGDYEQTGLLHTRIGELYQSSFVNTDHAIERYRRAIDCFETGQVSHRLAPAYLSLARMLLPIEDSVDIWKKTCTKGIYCARETNNLMCIIDGMNQQAHYLQFCRDYSDAKDIAVKVLKHYSGNCSFNYYRDFLSIAAESYAELGMTDSAEIYVDRIPARDAVSRMSRYRISADIAEKNNDWKKANQFLKLYHTTKDSLLNDGRTAQLSDKEQSLEIQNLELKHENEKFRLQKITYMAASIVAAAMLLTSAVILRLRKIKSKARESLSKMKTLGVDVSDADWKKMNDSEIIFKYIDKVVQKDGNSKLSSEWVRKQIILVNDILDNFYIYRGNDSLSSGLSKLVDRSINKKNARYMTTVAVDILYPGFLKYLRTRYPKLTDMDIYYIAMMICGFSSNAQQILTGNKIESIYVARSKAGSKMNSDIPLSKILTEELLKYFGEQDANKEKS